MCLLIMSGVKNGSLRVVSFYDMKWKSDSTTLVLAVEINLKT